MSALQRFVDAGGELSVDLAEDLFRLRDLDKNAEAQKTQLQQLMQQAAKEFKSASESGHHSKRRGSGSATTPPIPELLTKWVDTITAEADGVVELEEAKLGISFEEEKREKRSSSRKAAANMPAEVILVQGNDSIIASEAEPTYCYCQKVSHGEMVACDNPDCPIEWFHFGCVGLVPGKKVSASWMCKECKEKTKAKGKAK